MAKKTTKKVPLKKVAVKQRAASIKSGQLPLAKPTALALTLPKRTLNKDFALAIPIFFAAIVILFQIIYTHHIMQPSIGDRTYPNTAASLNSQPSLNANAANSQPILSNDSPANPTIPSSEINVLGTNATVPGAQNQTANMATPGQATSSVPLQTQPQAIGQTGGSTLQAGSGTGGLDPSQF
jgi:hypothetical protein